MSWLLLAIILAGVAVLSRGWMRAYVGRTSVPEAYRRWGPWLLRIGLWLLVVACLLKGAVAVLEQTAHAQAAMPAYTTSHPGKNPPWFGLAAPDGRYEVLLADGCGAIGADMNVWLARGDDSNEAQWLLQPRDSDQVCSVAEWHWMGNTPCATNPDTGECDVSNA